MMRGERKHGPGVACGLASVVILLLATAAGSAQARRSAAPPATPLAAKQAARTALAGLLPAKDKSLDTLVRKAVGFVDQSLTPAWWLGGWTLDPKLGGGVFTAERNAVVALTLINKPPKTVGTVESVLAGVDRQLSKSAIDAAAGGDKKELAKAKAAQLVGAALEQRGQWTLAIDAYGEAWKHATAAVPPGPRTFTLQSCQFADLETAVELANATADADTIVLEAGCTYLVAGSGPLVTQPLTIRGNGATLTRDSTSPIGPLLRVQGWAGSGGFAVDDVTFTGGTGTQGALSVQPGGDTSSPAPTVTVTNSRFHDNTQLQVPDFDPGYVGAGLTVENPPFKPGNPVTLLNDVFERNSTYDGPAGSELNSWEDRAGGAVSIGATGPVEITGCTFTGNRTGDTPAVRNTFGAFPSFGGAIFSQAPLTVTDSVFTGNATGTGGSGGAIASDRPGSALTLVHDTFDGNHSQGGFGGAVHVGQAALSVESSTFSGNWTDKDNFGAAIQAGADVSIAGSTFTGNHSGSAGAAIWWSSMPGGDHVLTVADSTFTGNSGIVAQACQSGPCGDRVAISGSTFGGNSGRPAITLNATGPGADPHSDRGLLDVVNSTITAEATTDWVGGGIDVGQSTARVTNVTIVIDGAASAGITAEAGAEVTVANTIVAGSQPHCVTNTGGAGGTIVDAGGNLMTPGVVGCPAGFLVGDPALGALADNGGPTWTMALGAGSAAIDKGVDALCPATDQRGLGFPRPVGAGCDIGAFEVQQP